MDLNIILAGITLLLLIVIGLVLYKYPITVKPGNEKKDDPPEGQRGPPARNQRARMRANAARQRQEALGREEDAGAGEGEGLMEEAEGEGDVQTQGKVGAKKRAKLEAKAEKRAAREVEEQLREERKAKDAQLMEDRRRQEELEKAEEQRRLEEERREVEEREQKEQEEYQKMKEAFSVEGEGYDQEGGDDDEKNLLQEFITYIQNNKVVIIEDLAAHFHLKTQAAIDRLTVLQSEGRLTGVVDDRGKFIYISQEELEGVAKFIKQRGRVSLADLVDSSNQLISLAPVVTTRN